MAMLTRQTDLVDHTAHRARGAAVPRAVAALAPGRPPRAAPDAVRARAVNQSRAKPSRSKPAPSRIALIAEQMKKSARTWNAWLHVK